MSIGCLSYFQLFSRPPGTATGMATDDMGVQHPCTPVRVLVLGHSFVRRLREHLDHLATPPFGLRPAGHLVRLVGLGGLWVLVGLVGLGEQTRLVGLGGLGGPSAVSALTAAAAGGLRAGLRPSPVRLWDKRFSSGLQCRAASRSSGGSG